MRILLVLENLSNRCGANVNIVLNLVKHLLKENEIYVLTRCNKDKSLDSAKISLFTEVFSFQYDQSEYISEFQMKNKWENCSYIRKILLLLSHPKLWISMMDARYNDFSLAKGKYQKELEKICKIQEIDIVVGVTAPYYIARAVGNASINPKKVVLQLDPYTYNYTLPHIKIRYRAKIEAKIIEQIDTLFAVSFVKDEIERKKITNHMEKVKSFELPGISLDENFVSETKKTNTDSKSVHFFFIGQFYEAIRSPVFLLELFSCLPNHFYLHLVGGGTPLLIKDYKKRLGERLVCHGWLSNVEAKEKMQEADILVNLNNTIENQLASKLFEYINTGKPILNICKNENCLSRKYTEKYENCLDVIESSRVCDELVERVVSFVFANKGYVVNRKSILDKFRENSDVYVAQLLQTVMKECVEVKKL